MDSRPGRQAYDARAGPLAPPFYLLPKERTDETP